eukprot:SAG11_NODE_3209_length_2609_cov_1.149402_1_plen_48_part_10
MARSLLLKRVVVLEAWRGFWDGDAVDEEAPCWELTPFFYARKGGSGPI